MVRYAIGIKAIINDIMSLGSASPHGFPAT